MKTTGFLNNAVQELVQQIPVIEERLSYRFNDKSLLILAFVHRSFYNENRDLVTQHNERLEFLGDSVLGLIISDYLYEKLPSFAEGQLSHLRSHLVEASSCVQYLQKLGIAEFVLLGKGERMNDGRGRDTILADLFEALIGAIYLDGGLNEAKRVFLSHFDQEIEAAFNEPLRNWKAELQDYSQKKHQKPPVYKVIKETGPDHSKVFHVVALIEDSEVGTGEGSSKKQAEQAAAEDALKRLN
ncbi:MAG TPA: ribonuclease III [Rhabdochlamydiaceae bacterium]|nr:ribonuclease III [Rhabdochlamydiaceae bacterium]